MRYSFRVVIEQDEPEQKRNFGTPAQWALFIQEKLNKSLHTANVVSVSPIRNKSEKIEK